MTTTIKVSWCADCATPIIGGSDRCPACQGRQGRTSVGRILISWLVFVEILGIVVLGILLASRGCV